MAKQDFYELLGVGRDAGPDDIKKAYRKLAMQVHPDRNPGDKVSEQRFKDITEAYDVLKDEQKRAAYDRFGHAAFEQGGGRGQGDFGGGGGFADIFEEMFGSMMGGGAPPRRRQPRQRPALQSRDHPGGSLQGPRDPRSGSRRSGRASRATAAAPSRARSRPPARPVAAPEGCARNRVSSPWSAPARPATAPAR